MTLDEAAVAADHALDRFGNPIAPGLPYARGEIVTSTVDDLAKLRVAGMHLRRHIGSKGHDDVYNFSGLERRLPIGPEELLWCDDELAPALFGAKLTELGLEHLGGERGVHDVAVMNRVTAGIFAGMLTLVRPGQTVVGFSARYSHPVVPRSAVRSGGRFVEHTAVEDVVRALDEEPDVGLLVVTRLSVSYELLPLAEIEAAIAAAKSRGVLVMVDDAGGARVGPAVFDQPRMLELGADIGVTGLDKYGVIGPRLGLLGARADIAQASRATAVELGLEARPMLWPAVVRTLEQYRPERVRELVRSTHEVGDSLAVVLGGDRIWRTEVIIQLKGEDILELAMQRAGLTEAPIVPYEATAALAMLLLRDHGVLTVHFAGLPPGTSALMLKFLPPETVARFGGPDALAAAVDACVDTLADVLRDPDPDRVRRLLLAEVTP